MWKRIHAIGLAVALIGNGLLASGCGSDAVADERCGAGACPSQQKCCPANGRWAPHCCPKSWICGSNADCKAP
jgi:hypothetical protein